MLYTHVHDFLSTYSECILLSFVPFPCIVERKSPSFYINSKALAIHGNYKCQKPLTLLTRFKCGGGDLFVAIFIGRCYSTVLWQESFDLLVTTCLKKKWGGMRLFGPDRHFLRFLEDWALLYIWEIIHRLCSTRWWTQRGIFRRERLNITVKLFMV